MKKAFCRLCYATVVMMLQFSAAHGQIIINEVMISPNPPSGSAPNTNEWIELMNTSGADFDIGCMIISDGDFALTIPLNTTLGAGETYLIGAPVSGLVPDLDWASCGCSSNLLFTGSFTDVQEQIFLYDNGGNLVDGVMWGGGIFGTPSINSTASNGCPSVFSLDFSADPLSPLVENINVVSGQSNAEDCAGTGMGNYTPTPGTTNINQIPVAVIVPDDTDICSTETVNFNSTGSLGATTFGWTGGTSLSNLSTYDNVSFSSSGNQTVSLTVTNTCLQSATTSVSINVEAAIEPVVLTTATQNPSTGNYEICENPAVPPQITVNAPVGTTIEWLLNGSPIPGATGTSYEPLIDGSYSVSTVSATGFCTETSTAIDLVLLPTPVASITNTDIEVCVNEPLLLEALSGFDSYEWIENGTAVGALSTYDVATSAPGTFNLQLIVELANCVSDPLDLSAIVNDIPVAEITPADSVELCPDEDVVLNSLTTHEQYQWYSEDVALPAETSQSFNFVYDTGEVSVTLTVTDNGCTSQPSAPVIITSYAVPNSADWNLPPYAEDNVLATCLDEYPLSTSTDGDYLQWYLDGAALVGETDFDLNATSDGAYYYTAAMNESGICPLFSDTLTVVLEVDLAIETIATKDTACVGDTVQIIPAGAFVSYTWSGGFEADTLEVTNTGIYVVTGHLVSCDTTDTVSVFFSDYPVIDAGKDFYSDCEDNTMLYGSTNGDSTFWELDDILIAFGDTVVIPTPTRSSELVMVSYLNQCEARDTVSIEVDCVYIFAPTAITPDGDGLNDVFRVYANGITQYVLRIFNRFGQVVFETTDPDAVWTGGYNDYFLPNGIYTWQIEALDYNQQEALSKARSRGSILVVR